MEQDGRWKLINNSHVILYLVNTSATLIELTGNYFSIWMKKTTYSLLIFLLEIWRRCAGLDISPTLSRRTSPFCHCFRSHTVLDEMCSPLLVIREKETWFMGDSVSAHCERGRGLELKTAEGILKNLGEKTACTFSRSSSLRPTANPRHFSIEKIFMNIASSNLT
jgi:hypothetical protein